MLTGSADLTLKSLQMILADIEVVAGDGIGNQILVNIKNTISDRRIVEKKFNDLLEGYRKEILPSIVDVLSEDEKLHFSLLNNFFCGMHLVVGMADYVLSSSLQWENTYFDELPSKHVLVCKSEPGVIQLIHTACKALDRHGCEKSGVYTA